MMEQMKRPERDLLPVSVFEQSRLRWWVSPLLTGFVSALSAW